MERPSVSSIYYEFGGGLGDIFFQMFHGGVWRTLEELGPEEWATIALVTHNPHARELFENHRNRSQMEIIDCGYWMPQEDAANRRRLKLPLPSRRGHPDYFTEGGWRLMEPERFNVWPTDEDRAAIAETHFYQSDAIIFAASAGESFKSFPEELAVELLEKAVGTGRPVVLVGRSYERNDRAELFAGCEDRRCINLINRLTVPGVAKLVQEAHSIVCCHSAVNMLAWCLRKPQLLLYPEQIRRQHFIAKDQWSFGADFPETEHGLFDDPQVTEKAERVFGA